MMQLFDFMPLFINHGEIQDPTRGQPRPFLLQIVNRSETRFRISRPGEQQTPPLDGSHEYYDNCPRSHFHGKQALSLFVRFVWFVA